MVSILIRNTLKGPRKILTCLGLDKRIKNLRIQFFSECFRLFTAITNKKVDYVTAQLLSYKIATSQIQLDIPYSLQLDRNKDL